MARLMTEEKLFFIQPKRPEPINIAYRVVVSHEELRYMWKDRDPKELANYVKREMTYGIAKELMERCAPFVVDSIGPEGRVYQIEVYLSDRGAYEHWLPQERRAGANEGFKEAVKRQADRTPYGFETDQFYE